MRDSLRISVYNFVPDYCPECGIVTQFHGPYPISSPKIEAFMAGGICACEHCGVHFQYAYTDHLLLATFAQGHTEIEDIVDRYIQEEESIEKD